MHETSAGSRETKSSEAFKLWAGMLLPPLAWGIQLQALYLASEYGCTSSDFTWNHIIVVGALILSVTGLAISWRQWSKRGAPDHENNRLSVRRFMSMLGILSGALFALTIFAQWLPTLMGVPCDK